MLSLNRTDYPSADLFEVASALAAALAGAEVDVVTSVLPAAQSLMPVAEAEGVTAAHFEQEDLRLLFCACDVARHLPLIDLLKLARRALREAGYWDPHGPVSRGSCCLWSDESLALAADAYPPSTATVQMNARHLISLSRRWRMAETLVRRLRTTLTADAPRPRRLIEPIIITNAPARRRGVA